MKAGDVVEVVERVPRMTSRDLVPGDWGVIVWWDARAGRTEQGQIAFVGFGSLWGVPVDALRVVYEGDASAPRVHVVNVDEGEAVE